MDEFSADQIWNNLLKEIARQAFFAGDIGAVHDPEDFEEWWEAFVEQNHTDG